MFGDSRFQADDASSVPGRPRRRDCSGPVPPSESGPPEAAPHAISRGVPVVMRGPRPCVSLYPSSCPDRPWHAAGSRVLVNCRFASTRFGAVLLEPCSRHQGGRPCPVSPQVTAVATSQLARDRRRCPDAATDVGAQCSWCASHRSPRPAFRPSRCTRRTASSAICSATPACDNVGTLDLPNTYPIVIGEIPAPPGAPTVLLYGHYDVVPPGDESKWTRRRSSRPSAHGALYGRGASDSKANVMAHVGALRAFNGKPPVGIKVVIEGQEEVGQRPQHLPAASTRAVPVRRHGDLRHGQRAPGRTDAHGRPSGHGGRDGRSEDARRPQAQRTVRRRGARCADHARCTRSPRLHDADGNVAVPGLRREEWTGASYSEDEFRELAEDAAGLPFFGTGGLGERLWSGPADHRDRNRRAAGRQGGECRGAARARQDQSSRPSRSRTPTRHRHALDRHLRSLRPFGIALDVTPDATGNGFAAQTSGPAYDAARAALSTPGAADRERRDGGSIPLVNALHTARSRTPRSCSLAPPTDSAISTRRTSGSCSTNSGRP